MFSSFQICRELLESPNKWRTGWDSASNSAYAINQDKVVVYDNAQSLMNKAEYVMKKKLAGVMIWSIDTDDFRGDCSELHTEYLDPLLPSNYPLMRIINSALAKQNTHRDDNSIDSSPSSSPATITLSSLAIFVVFSSTLYA